MLHDRLLFIIIRAKFFLELTIERFTIECRFVIALVLLHFVEKNLAPLYHPMRTENQNQLRDSLACVFPAGRCSYHSNLHYWKFLYTGSFYLDPKCKDRVRHCAAFKRSKKCEKKENWIKVKCAQTCGFCGKLRYDGVQFRDGFRLRLKGGAGKGGGGRRGEGGGRWVGGSINVRHC